MPAIDPIQQDSSLVQRQERAKAAPEEVSLADFPHLNAQFYSQLNPADQAEFRDITDELTQHFNSPARMVLAILEQVFATIQMFAHMQTERELTKRDDIEDAILTQGVWSDRKALTYLGGAFGSLFLGNAMQMGTQGVGSWLDKHTIKPNTDLRLLMEELPSLRQMKEAQKQMPTRILDLLRRLKELETQTAQKATQA